MDLLLNLLLRQIQILSKIQSYFIQYCQEKTIFSDYDFSESSKILIFSNKNRKLFVIHFLQGLSRAELDPDYDNWKTLRLVETCLNFGRDVS